MNQTEAFPNMNEELDNSLQLEQFTQVKSLLNRLLQSLDDENGDKARIHNCISSMCQKENMDPNAILGAKVKEADKGRLDYGNELIYQRDLLLSRLQREKYLSKQYEDILRRHEKVMRVINANLKNRLKLEHGAKVAYNAEAERQMKNYAESIEKMRQMGCEYEDEYSSAKERLAQRTREFNDVLNDQ